MLPTSACWGSTGAALGYAYRLAGRAGARSLRNSRQRMAPVGWLRRLPSGQCCICAEDVVGEYQSGGWSYAEGCENGPKLPIVDVIGSLMPPSGGLTGR